MQEGRCKTWLGHGDSISSPVEVGRNWIKISQEGTVLPANDSHLAHHEVHQVIAVPDLVDIVAR